MQPAVSRVDLHAHTTASDGTLRPAELVKLALERGLTVLGITDHDSTEGIAEALQAAAGTPLRIIPGVEINTDVPAGEVHVLGYFIDTANEALQRQLSLQRSGREARARLMVEKLAALGLHISWERVLELAQGGAIGRPHIAQALVERGYVATPAEAFEKYIGHGGPAYVERTKLTPAEAVALIRQAGGVPVLAHPTFSPAYEALVAELVEAGLAGLECYYAGYDQETVVHLLMLAQRHGLIPTGGSDFHGLALKEGADLGSVYVPPEVVEQLDERKAALDRDRSSSLPSQVQQ
jgi:predicted metal-dependent phosphoesterase TrpH